MRRASIASLIIAVLALSACVVGCGRGHRRVSRRVVAPAHGPLAPDIAAFTDVLADEVTGEFVGISASRSVEYETYQRLSRRLDRDGALRLLVDRRPAIRAWAARHVIEHLPQDGDRVLPLTRDRATIRTQAGCLGGTSTVAAWAVPMLARHRRRDLLAFVAQDPRVPVPERVRALSELGPSDAAVVERVARALLEAPGPHHSSVIAAIGATRASSAADLVWRFSKSESAWNRAAVADVLAVTPTPEASAGLLTLAADRDLGVRRRAIVAYAASPNGDWTTKQRLLATYPWGDFVLTREQLLAEVAQFGTDAVPGILDAAQAPERTLAMGMIPPAALEASPSIREWLRRKVTGATPIPRPAAAGRERWDRTEASAALEVLARSADAKDVVLALPFLESGDPLERRAAAEVILAAGGAKDVERVLADDRYAPEAAERLFWLRSFSSIDAIRALGREPYGKRFERVAVDLERLRDGRPPSIDDLPPRVSVEPVAMDCLGVTDADASIRRALPELRSAYRELAARDDAPTGDVRVTLLIDGRGAVHGAVPDPRDDPRLGALARGSSIRMRFEANLVGRCTTTFRFGIQR